MAAPLACCVAPVLSAVRVGLYSGARLLSIFIKKEVHPYALVRSVNGFEDEPHRMEACLWMPRWDSEGHSPQTRFRRIRGSFGDVAGQSVI